MEYISYIYAVLSQEASQRISLKLHRIIKISILKE